MRMILRFRPALLCSALLVCWRIPIPAQNPGPTANMQTLTADTPRTTPGGVPFTVPAGWSVGGDSSSVSILAPEADTHVVIFDEQAPDAASAVAQAWAKYRPGFNRPLKTAVAVPDRDG